MTPENKAELWRLAHEAFDNRRMPSADETLLDWLVQHPECMGEMDRILELESELGALDSHSPVGKTRSRPWLAILPLAAAAALVATVPSLWKQAPDPVPSVPVASHSDGSTTTPKDPHAHSPSGAILSYEFEIESQRPHVGELAGSLLDSESDAGQPRVTIHTFTSTRTRSAPRSANLTF
ncbi:MAG: hypothetical protein P1V35_01415 [Planctomycetota bacterium]|nr:hypothetical protein [Planctomycetota bacterium]